MLKCTMKLKCTGCRGERRGGIDIQGCSFLNVYYHNMRSLFGFIYLFGGFTSLSTLYRSYHDR